MNFLPAVSDGGADSPQKDTVIGFDIAHGPEHGAVPEGCELVIQDCRTLEGFRMQHAAVIVASPPCDEFSRWMMPWTRARNPPKPSLDLIETARRIAREAGLSLILENVREAQNWIGPAAAHYGSRYLWGDVPALMPFVERERPKESMSSTWRAKRAEIPFPLSTYIARVFKPC